MQRILIVDDQRDIRRMLRAGLETLGLQLQIVDLPSGEEAVLVLKQQPHIDLMVVDVWLPGISGLELLEQARALNPGLKLILVTGISDSQIRQKLPGAGADAFFFKPFEMSEFLAAAGRLLAESSAGNLPAQEAPQREGFASDPLEGPPSGTHPETGIETGAVETPALFLARLRHETGASAALVLDGSGRILERSGNLPEAGQGIDLVFSMLLAFEAGKNVSVSLGGENPASLAYYAGAELDLYAAQLDRSRALILVVRKPEAARPAVDILNALGNALGIVPGYVPGNDPALKAARALWQAGGDPAATVQEKTTEGEPAVQPDLQELADLFAQPALEAGQKGDLDAFWEEVSSSTGAAAQPGPGTGELSFDEARRLGLAPEEEDG